MRSSIGSGLINVRLDAERLHKVRRLRQQGVKLSQVVREAIDERFRQLRPEPELRGKALIERIFAQHPDPTGLPARGYDVHDRRAARRAILRQLRNAPR